MPKYVIEREVPGAGSSTPDDLRDAARESLTVLRDLGPNIQWLESFVTDDKIYCVYVADGEDVIREHARCLDLPADRITRVRAINDPARAE